MVFFAFAKGNGVKDKPRASDERLGVQISIQIEETTCYLVVACMTDRGAYDAM